MTEVAKALPLGVTTQRADTDTVGPNHLSTVARTELGMLVPDQRNVVLITHATPEDNAFSRWLGARLASAGYKVWVDLKSLRGGDDFGMSSIRRCAR